MIHDAYMYTGFKTPESADISPLRSSDLYQVCNFISFFSHLTLSMHGTRNFRRGGGGGGGDLSVKFKLMCFFSNSHILHLSC